MCAPSSPQETDGGADPDGGHIHPRHGVGSGPVHARHGRPHCPPTQSGGQEELDLLHLTSTTSVQQAVSVGQCAVCGSSPVCLTTANNVMLTHAHIYTYAHTNTRTQMRAHTNTHSNVHAHTHTNTHTCVYIKTQYP